MPTRLRDSILTMACWSALLSFAIGLSATATPAAAGPPAPAQAAGGADHATRPAKPPKANPAAEKFWQAVTIFRANVPANLADGRAALQASSDLEYTHAQVLLGGCYMTGSYGFKKSERKGANLYRLAAERGNAYAMVSLGTCYVTGQGVWKDEAKAIAWLKAAVAPNADFSRPDPPLARPAAEASATEDSRVAGVLIADPVSTAQAGAHYILGLLLFREKQRPEAQAHFVAAATAGPDGHSGILQAAIFAAVNYAFGQGVPRDLAKANEMLAQSKKLKTRLAITLVHNVVALKMADEFAAADLEDAFTEGDASLQANLQLEIAHALADKKSKDYNVAEAVKWYELAADSGQAWAMLSLAFIHYRGDLGQPDPARAFQYFEKAGSGDKPKHFLAAANLAICCQNGIGTNQDPARAAAIFRHFRDEDIVCYLGSIGQCPAAPVTYEQALALNETWAKKKKDPQAQYLLGDRYLNGWGLARDPEDAAKWFKKAAKAGHAGALYSMGAFAEYDFRAALRAGRTVKKSRQTAIEYYQKASDAGSVEGTASLANMLRAGNGASPDLAKAEALYLKCLQMDSKFAQADNQLGEMYQDMLRQALKAHDEPRAVTARTNMLAHYTRASGLEYDPATTNLGALYYQGELVPQDFQKAYAYFSDSAEHGSASAHYGLGLMHEQGQGVPVTYTEAAYHYRIAALEGHPDALRHLINFYLTGQGVSLDLDRALFWLQRMYEAGNPLVLTTYCDVLLKRKSYEDAISLLDSISDDSNRMLAGFACDRLATCYAQGLGVRADASEARRYSELAIKYGNGDAVAKLGLRQLDEGKVTEALANLHRAAETSRQACYALGVMYYNGTKVAKNETEGLKYMQTAAAANYTEALYFLASLTYHHNSGAPSLDQAILHAQQAEANGHAKAGALREELERRRREENASPEEAGRRRSS
jgi:TPR repeat protein